MYGREIEWDEVVSFCDQTGCFVLTPEEAGRLGQLRARLEALLSGRPVPYCELHGAVEEAARVLKEAGF